MTEFGRIKLDTILRMRLIFIASSLVLVFLIELRLEFVPIWGLLVLLGLNLVMALLAPYWRTRIGTPNMVRMFLALDTALIVVSVFLSGGITGGWAALYAVPPFIALLVLGRQDAIWFALVGGVCFLVQILLQLNGVYVFAFSVPFWVGIVGQSAVIVILLTLIVVFSTAATGVTEQLHHDKDVAQEERLLAEKAQQRWALINDVSWRMQEATTPRQVFETIGEELERRGLHCAIFEWARPEIEMQIAFVSIPAQALQEILANLRVDLETFRVRLRNTSGILDAVTKRQTVLIDNPLVSLALLFPQLPRPFLAANLKRVEMGAMILAPMVFDERVNGVLMVFADTLNETDVVPFAAFANQTASALEKARLLSEQRKRAAQLEIVSTLSARLGSAEALPRTLQTIVEQVQNRFGYHVVGILEIDSQGASAYMLAGAGLLVARVGKVYAQSLDRGILGAVAQSGELYLSANTKLDVNYLGLLGAEDPVNSELTIPLKQGNTVIGLLDVQSIHPNGFDPSDVSALRLLAEQIAGAMSKSRALAAQQKRALQLAWVSQVTAQATASDEPDAIIKSLVDLVQTRFQYHHVCFSLFDAEAGEMVQRAIAGNNADLYEPGERWSASKGLIGLAARTAQTVASGDVRRDPRFLPDRDDVSGANSELCVPFIAADRVLGVLDVEGIEHDAFDSNDIGAMETLAAQMALILERAYSLQSEKRRNAQMSLVYRIASRTARLVPVDELIREAVNLIHDEFGYFNVAIFENSAEHSVVRLLANAGALDVVIDETPLISSRGIVWTVASTGTMHLSQDTRIDPLYHCPFPPGVPDPVCSEITVPLRRGASVIGVLDIQSERRNEFSPADVTVLEIMADQLATALENARLFESEAQRAAQLEAVRVLALDLTAERDLKVLLQSIILNVIRLVDADGGTLDLIDKARGDLVVYISHNLSQDYTGYRLALGEGLAGMAAATGEPLIVKDYAKWEKHLAAFPSEMWGGMMAVPLKWQTRVLGVIGLHRRRGRPQFEHNDLHLVGLFAAQAAIALENANLFDALQARLHALRTLTATSAPFLELTDAQEILDRAAQAAHDALHTQSVLLFLAPENDVPILYSLAGSAFALPEAGQLRGTFSAILDKVAEHQAPIFWHTNDASALDVLMAPVSLDGLRVGLAVPLQMGERVGGVLVVTGSGLREYNATDAELLSLLANQTASALERAFLFRQEQRRVRELNLLFEGFRDTASTLEPKQVIERLLAQLVRALDVTSGYYVTIDHTRRELKWMYEYLSTSAGAIERRVSPRVLGFDVLPELERLLQKEVVLTRREDPTILPQVREYMQGQGVYTILRVPLAANDRVLGYLALWETRGPRFPDTSEIRFVETMASQAAVALVNAELYQAAQNRSRELLALYEAGRLLNSSLDLRAICENSVDALRDILGYYHVSIYFLVDGYLELQVQRGYRAQDALYRIPITKGIMGRAVRTRQTLYLPDVSESQDFLQALKNPQSEIAVPLMVSERVLGVLNVESVASEPSGVRNPLMPEDVQLLNTFANQLVAAIENAKLYQDAQRRLQESEALYRYARELGGTMDIRILGARALDAVARLVDFDFGEVALVREADRVLEALVTRGGVNLDASRMTIPFGSGITGWVAEHGRAVRLGDVTRDPRYIPSSEYIMSEVCLPLRVGDRTVGVLNLEAKAPYAFDAYLEQLLTVFANQLAIAIDNARLYEQTKRDAEVKAVLLRELSHRVKNNLAAITSLLYMALDEPPGAREQILSETLGRVQSMATAHTLLARTADGYVNLLEVGSQVIRDTVRNLAPPNATLAVETGGDQVHVVARQLTTLALVLNELATNTLRHGWNRAANDALTIRFMVMRQEDWAQFVFQDNGRNLASDFEFDAQGGLGLTLVRSLVEKDLHGMFDLVRRDGWTNAQIRFRLEKETI